MGLERSIANWFLLPYGLALDQQGLIAQAGVIGNLAAVTAGNIAGGTLLVAGVYWIAYLRGERAARQSPSSGVVRCRHVGSVVTAPSSPPSAWAAWA